MTPFTTIEELQNRVWQFESKTMPYEEWTHRQHLGVACWYVLNYGDLALDFFRSRLIPLNEHFGVPQTPTGGYHETITRAWISRISAERARHSDLPALDFTNWFIATYGDKSHLLDFYSRDAIMSIEARYGYIPPDIKSFES